MPELREAPEQLRLYPLPIERVPEAGYVRLDLVDELCDRRLRADGEERLHHVVGERVVEERAERARARELVGH